ncbi:MAG: aldehyde ferredoxin oxidoreductase family protein [Candidatus Heimdallarchaeaceae archaeon]
MINGYAGKILHINLTTKKIEEEKPSEEIYKQYLGGIGLGVKYLFDNIKPNIDPLGSDNIIGFVTGLFSATNYPFSGRYTVVGKSPLTGTWSDANSGGFFGPELKKAGYDMVLVKGKSDKPVYIWISNGKTEIRDAKSIWGKDTTDTESILKEELNDPKIRIVSIGQSGEKLSLISCVMHDHGRAASRGGLGAVMGSKKLKAIVVRGEEKIPIADPKKLKSAKNKVLDIMKTKPALLGKILTPLLNPFLPWMLKKGITAMPDTGAMVNMWKTLGTTGLVSASAQMGDSPTKNWGGSGAKDFPMRTMSSKISDEKIQQFVEKPYGCQSCPLRCGAILHTEGPFQVKDSHRPEYESIAAFGSMLLNDNVEAVLKANDACNRYGIDTISAGGTIAFAMECYENGILTKEDTDGIELTWGNPEAIMSMLDKLANREGFGDVLADGVKVASEKIGKGSEKYAMHVKGQEVPMHDPRLNPSFGATYVSDPTPGRHTMGGAGFDEFGLPLNPVSGIDLPKVKRYQYTGKGLNHSFGSKVTMAMNCLNICLFSAMFGDLHLIEAIEGITGWDYSLEEFLEVGERVQNLRQAFNVREGFKPSDFVLPDRIKGIPPLDSGPTAGVTIDLDSMVNEFYEFMDWNKEDGKPSKEKLQSLGLDNVIKEIYT